jgi:nitrate/nitrite transporter NarK
MAGYFVLMLIGIGYGFGSVFYMQNALTPFMLLVFVLGLGGANFALYTLWIPEQYTTECRGSAIGFTSSVGRFMGVAMVFLVGAGIQRYGSLGVPVAVTAIAFVIGLLVLPAAKETRGEPLPA